MNMSQNNLFQPNVQIIVMKKFDSEILHKIAFEVIENKKQYLHIMTDEQTNENYFYIEELDFYDLIISKENGYSTFYIPQITIEKAENIKNIINNEIYKFGLNRKNIKNLFLTIYTKRQAIDIRTK